MTRPGAGVLLLGLLALLLVPAPDVLAHPVGNFTVNRYSLVELSADRVQLRYVVDMAEIPTVTELARLDANHDGEISEAERSDYIARKVDQFLGHITLLVDGKPAQLHVTASLLELLPGEAGLQTLRLTETFEASVDLPAGRPISMSYQDDNFEAQIGWREVVVRAGRGIQITRSDAPSVDRSNELRDYPKDLLSNPPGQSEAQATFLAVAAGSGGSRTGAEAAISPGRQFATSLASQSPSLLDVTIAPLADRVRSVATDSATGGLTSPGLLLALCLAAVWGAAHALSPGHGKTVVGAYLVGSHGTPWHALYLGLTVTATHTLGIYLLGLITLFAAQFLLPETLYKWSALISSLAVVAIGANLIVERTQRFGASVDATHNHARYGHEHEHDHHLGGHQHRYDLSHEELPAHSHGRRTHTHLPPRATGDKVRWQSLLALGVAGGMLPCPSALVLMLGAIALGQVALGLVLVVAFSVGLAVVLTAIGLAFVYLGRIATVDRLPWHRQVGMVARLAPTGSAVVISLIGLAMTYESLTQMGFPGR